MNRTKGRGQVFETLLGLIIAGVAAISAPASAQTYAPYPPTSAANALYGVLFCDDLSAFKPPPGQKLTGWGLLLFGPHQDPTKIAALANDPTAESRVRALAFAWLRAHGHPTPKGVVLGVIIEAPLDAGLDTVAAYADGTVRYINQTGKMAIIEPGGSPAANQAAKRLVELAGPVVARIGPWDKPRRPPPVKPNLRVTFIVSDGLYFGEGPFEAMADDPGAGPLVQQGVLLLSAINHVAEDKAKR